MEGRVPENLHYFTDGKTLKGIDLPQYPDSAWNWITGAPEDTKDEELYSRVAAVYRVANLSAEAIANVPFAVLKGETEYDTSDDWQNKVGFLPNIRELLRLWRLSLFMTNSAYGFMEGNRVSKNLRYVVPSTITPQIDKWEGLTGFKRRIGTETTEYSLKDNRIFWMWRLDHTTELLPSKNSEFRALMAAAGVLYYADYYVQNFFQRGGIRPALLQVAGVPTREEREKIESVWDKIIHGWSKYLGKVISANEMDVKVIGDGIDALSNSQIHNEKLADVAMAAGMPLSIILANSANYATAQTEYIVWFRDSVIPWANFMQDEINDKLFNPLGLRFEFRPEMSDKGQEEEAKRAGAYRAYVASGMKPSIAAQVVGIDLPADIEYEDLDDVFVPPAPQPVNETEIPIEKAEEPEAEIEKSVTLLTIDQLRELEHWQDLAFRKLKQGKSLAFPWVSKTLPEEVASVIRDRLPGCKTTAEIERAFDLNMPDTPDHQLRELADALNKAVEAVEVKYSDSQPRVPAGHSDGGQWTDGSGDNDKRNKSIYDAEKYIYLDQFERAFVIDKDGNIVVDKNGDQSSVTFTDDEFAKMKNCVLTHNHPSGSTLSKEDGIMAIEADLASVRAVTTGQVYCLDRPIKGWPGVDSFKITYNYFYEQTIKEFRNQIETGVLTVEQANETIGDLIWNRVAGYYKFTYKSEKHGW